MKTPAAPPADGLDWLRAIRRRLQREIGITPQERAAYYQAKEKKLHARMRPRRSIAVRAK